MQVAKPLIKQQLVSKRLLYKPCAIIMGRTGAGKTTLVNALCGTEHVAGEGKGSVTRHLYLNDVACGENAFSLIDTPGTDSASETYKHAILLREGLTATKINTIFILIKYDSRFDKMTENYFEIEQPVYNYTNKIVVMISHWDLAKNSQKNYEEICKLFHDECPTVTNLIFYSEQSSKSTIANLMYNCISNMENEQLKIGDEEISKKKTNALVDDYTDLIDSSQYASVEDKDEVLHMTIVQFKNEMETLLQEFQQKHGGAMIELDYYVFSIKMQKENVKICDEFVKRVVPLMSYNLFDNQDPRNLIKRCPYCKLIWFKTEGSDGITRCGNNKFREHTGVTSKVFWKYQLQRIGGKLLWEKNPIQRNNVEENLQESSEESSENNRHSTRRGFLSIFRNIIGYRDDGNFKPAGCGRKFKWSELPKIEVELILELFKVKTIDQAKQLIQTGSFMEVRQNYESNIDMNFYS